jgi:hypothetical protein
MSEAQLVQSPFKDLMWENRLLIVQVELAGDAFHEQQQIFQSCLDGLMDRKLIVYYFSSSKALHTKNTKNHFRSLPKTWVKQFKKMKSTFAMHLIGLDGGVKKRWNEPTSCEDIFAIIDAMPMRQQEMKSE